MDAQEALSFALLCAGILAVKLVIQWRTYRRTLLPRRKRLEQVLASLHNEV
jgi:hypothetical protein